MGVVVGPEHQTIDIVGEVAFHVQAARAVSRHGDERHHHPIGGEQAGDPENLAAYAGVQVDRRGDQVADGDALQHAQNALRAQIEMGEGVDQKAEDEEHGGAPGHLRHQLEFGDARGQPLSQ